MNSWNGAPAEFPKLGLATVRERTGCKLNTAARKSQIFATGKGIEAVRRPQMFQIRFDFLTMMNSYCSDS